MDPFDPTGLIEAAATPTVNAPGTWVTKRGKTVTNTTKPKGAISRKTKQIIKLTLEHGVDAKDAYALVNDKPAAPSTLSLLKKKIEEYSITNPKMQRLAGRVIENVLRSKPIEAKKIVIDKATGRPALDPITEQPIEYTEKIYPSHTNMLAAASMVEDRVDPVVRQNVNLNGNLADFLPFELEKYR